MDEQKIKDWFINKIFLPRILWFSLFYVSIYFAYSLISTIFVQFSLFHPLTCVENIFYVFINLPSLLLSFFISIVACLPVVLSLVKLISCEEKKFDIYIDVPWMALFILANLSADLLFVFSTDFNQTSAAIVQNCLYCLAFVQSFYFSVSFLQTRSNVLRFPKSLKPLNSQLYYDVESVLKEIVSKVWKVWVITLSTYFIFGWKVFSKFDSSNEENNEQKSFSLKYFVWELFSFHLFWSSIVFTLLTSFRRNIVAKLLNLFLCEICNVQRLLLQNCEVNLADKAGRTALMYAALQGCGNVVQLLLGEPERVDVTVTDCLGNTALMYTAISGDDHVALMLLNFIKQQYGHEALLDYLDAENKSGETAISLSLKHGQIDCANILSEYLKYCLDEAERDNKFTSILAKTAKNMLGFNNVSPAAQRAAASGNKKICVKKNLKGLMLKMPGHSGALFAARSRDLITSPETSSTPELSMVNSPNTAGTDVLQLSPMFKTKSCYDFNEYTRSSTMIRSANVLGGGRNAFGLGAQNSQPQNVDKAAIGKAFGAPLQRRGYNFGKFKGKGERGSMQNLFRNESIEAAPTDIDANNCDLEKREKKMFSQRIRHCLMDRRNKGPQYERLHEVARKQERCVGAVGKDLDVTDVVVVDEETYSEKNNTKQPVEFIIPNPDPLPTIVDEDLGPNLAQALAFRRNETVRYLAYWDLCRLTTFSRGRVQQLFLVSRPGGHPRPWNAISSECVTFLESLLKSLDAKNSKLSHRWSLMGCRTANAFDKFNPPLQRYSADTQPDLSVVLTKPNWFSRLLELFGIEAGGDANFELSLNDWQLHCWNIEALGNILCASYVDDKLGVIQKDLAKIIGLFADLWLAIERNSRLSSTYYMGDCRRQKINQRRSAIKARLNVALSQVHRTFEKHINDIPIDDFQKKVLCSTRSITNVARIENVE